MAPLSFPVGCNWNVPFVVVERRVLEEVVVVTVVVVVVVVNVVAEGVKDEVGEMVGERGVGFGEKEVVLEKVTGEVVGEGLLQVP